MPITALLWGEAWRVAGAEEPLPFADLGEAADVLAAFFRDQSGPRRLRLIYQPDFLATVATPCPKAGRATLAAALTEEFPALGRRGCVWSHEPILQNGDHFTTLLHFERKPGLLELVARLESNGVEVEAAWPLPTYLHALPADWSDSGAETIVALEPGRAGAFRHAADGKRSAPVWRGEHAVAEAGAWLGEIFRQDKSEAVLLVGENDVEAELQTHVALDGQKNVAWLSWAGALARPATLPRRHPAQLLPPSPWFTPQRAAMAASLALFVGAAWSGTTYAQECLAWRMQDEARDARKRALRVEVAHLRANAAEISALRAALAGTSDGTSAAELLAKLAATVPPEVVLDSLKLAEGRFLLRGFVAPKAPAGVVDGWCARLADARWTVASAGAPGGAFTVSGNFKP